MFMQQVFVSKPYIDCLLLAKIGFIDLIWAQGVKYWLVNLLEWFQDLTVLKRGVRLGDKVDCLPNDHCLRNSGMKGDFCGFLENSQFRIKFTRTEWRGRGTDLEIMTDVLQGGRGWEREVVERREGKSLPTDFFKREKWLNCSTIQLTHRFLRRKTGNLESSTLFAWPSWIRIHCNRLDCQ